MPLPWSPLPGRGPLASCETQAPIQLTSAGLVLLRRGAAAGRLLNGGPAAPCRSDMKNLIQEACQGPVRDAVKQHGSGVAALQADDLRPVVLRDFQVGSGAQRVCFLCCLWEGPQQGDGVDRVQGLCATWVRYAVKVYCPSVLAWFCFVHSTKLRSPGASVCSNTQGRVSHV